MKSIGNPKYYVSYNCLTNDSRTRGESYLKSFIFLPAVLINYNRYKIEFGSIVILIFFHSILFHYFIVGCLVVEMSKSEGFSTKSTKIYLTYLHRLFLHYACFEMSYFFGGNLCSPEKGCCRRIV